MNVKLQCLLAVVLLTVALQGFDCLSWSSALNDGQVKYACAGKTLSIPWQLNLTSGQTISDIQWYFHGQSEEMIAILSHGHFMPMPAFAQRASQVGNAGIEVSHVTLGDTGNYSVEVSVQETSGSLTRVRHTVYVHVSDGLVTTDGRLQASLLPQPVLDSSSQQFALVLACGNFTYVGHPPFDVQWTDPRGNTLLSSTYAEGFFKLLLRSPVAGGAYSCQIPPSAAADACLPAATEVKVNVDETAARLSLLEANQAALREVDTQQKALLAQQSQHIQDLEANQTALKDVVTQQSQHIHDLEQQLDVVSRRVSFLAKLSSDLTTPSSTIVFRNVINNLGNGYSSSTGYFTAPYAGSYFFAFSNACRDTGKYSNAQIKSDNHEVCRTGSNVHQDAESCHGVEHLGRGQRVWVTPLGNFDCFDSLFTFFTGFLISADP